MSHKMKKFKPRKVKNLPQLSLRFQQKAVTVRNQNASSSTVNALPITNSVDLIVHAMAAAITLSMTMKDFKLKSRS